MECIYEIVDATDDETYYTIGVYSTLELALTVLDQLEPPQTNHCHDNWGVAEFEVRRRPVDKWSEHGKTAASVTWRELPVSDDDDEVRWDRTVEVKALAGGSE
jgi:hypothetical protein